MCFHKKKNVEDKPIFIPCSHKYRDFPWYTESTFMYQNDDNDIGKFEIKIIKPYVCVHCGHRKDIVVAEMTQVRISYAESENVLQDFEKEYEEYIKPRGIVEAEINDMILVDRAYLKIIDDLYNAKNAPSPFDTN